MSLDIVGMKFDEWEVLEQDTSVSSKKSKYICRCSCGTVRSLFRHNLVNGRTHHCGCKKKSFSDRFWEKVDKSGECWIWLGATTSDGYGRISIDGKQRGSHRISYEMRHGPIEDSRLEVCHLCDNPSCVNPDHLHLGTHKENMKEAAERHRLTNRLRGEDHPNSKLAEEDVKAIREAHEKGVSNNSLARMFGVTKGAISRVVKGVGWRHLP